MVVVVGIKKLRAGGGNQIQERVSHYDMHTLPMYFETGNCAIEFVSLLPFHHNLEVPDHLALFELNT